MFFFFFFEQPAYIKDTVNSVREYLSVLNNIYNADKTINIENAESLKDIDERDVRKNLEYYIGKKAKNLFNKYLSSKNKKEFLLLYRGVADLNYKTASSIYRGSWRKNEDKIINDIRVHYPELHINKSYIEELSGLQHYGCPTRLLDLTSNPLVALYFACLGKYKKFGEVRLFLAKKEEVLKTTSDKALLISAVSHLKFKDKEDLYKLCYGEIAKSKNAKLNRRLERNYDCVKNLYHEIRRCIDFEPKILCTDLLSSFYLQPVLDNSRIKAQAGLFLINGLSRSNDDCYEKNKNLVIARIKIPGKAKKVILKELDMIGINEKTMFPEIDHGINYFKYKISSISK